jgi:prevent-host-death family protein
MTTTVNVHEAKTHLSRLLNRVAAGEEIIIAKSGKPCAVLVPFGVAAQARKPGSARGMVTVAADFDDPLPDDLLRGFSG